MQQWLSPTYKEMAIIMSNKKLDHILSMSPIRIEFEITEACNLRCQFCYNTRNPLSISLPEAKVILDQLSNEFIPELVITGGEPLINDNFIDIFEYAHDRFPTVLLQTNGTLLDSVTMDSISNIGISGINVSLHGLKKEHELLSQSSGSYDKAILAIQNILSRNIPLWVNTVLTRINVDSIEDHLENLYSMGVRNFTFTRFTPTGIGKHAFNLSMSASQFLQTLYLIDKFRIKYNVFTLLANSIPYCFLPSDLKHFTEICTYGLTKFYVDIHGNLLYCGMSRIPLGNILNESISTIKSKNPIIKLNCENKLCPSGCQTCPHFMIHCRGGCRAAALTNGSITSIDPLSIQN